MPITLPDPSKTELKKAAKILESHAADIGHIALEWNALHDALGEMFAAILNADAGRWVVMAAWQSLVSDRAKRGMLVSAALADENLHARLAKDIKWTCDELNSLEDKRNDAIHTPFNILFEDGIFRVAPVLWTGHSRARKLKDKDLKIELRSYRANIRAMKKFVQRLIGFPSLLEHGATWPERPSLPRPAQATARKS